MDLAFHSVTATDGTWPWITMPAWPSHISDLVHLHIIDGSAKQANELRTGFPFWSRMIYSQRVFAVLESSFRVRRSRWGATRLVDRRLYDTARSIDDAMTLLVTIIAYIIILCTKTAGQPVVQERLPANVNWTVQHPERIGLPQWVLTGFSPDWVVRIEL